MEGPVTRQKRVSVASPQTRLAMSRRHPGVRADPPHLAPVDMERARSVYHAQLRAALGTLTGLAVLIVGLPVALAAFPGLDAVRLFGVPVSWLAVAVLPYAVLMTLAAWQLRCAESTERP